MSFLSWLGFGLAPTLTAPLPIAAWDVPANNQIGIVLSDIFGETISRDLLPVSRAEALTIPPVSAAHATITAAFGNLVLVAAGGAADTTQPGWLTETGRNQQPWYLRNVRTYADFMFLGFSLWMCKRGADGYPTNAWHVPYGKWGFDDTGTIMIEGESVDQNNVIFFESALPGLLNVGTRTLRQALSFEHTIAERARVSIPLATLTQTDDSPLDKSEIKEVVDGYRKAREARDGSAIAFVPSGFALAFEKEDAGTWLLEARNAVGADIAKLTGIPASRLGSTSSIDSLTYTTELGQMTDLMALTAHQYLDPIEARLSMGDVTPNGQTVTFDRTPLDKALMPEIGMAAPTPLAQPKKEGTDNVRQAS